MEYPNDILNLFYYRNLISSRTDSICRVTFTVYNDTRRRKFSNLKNHPELSNVFVSCSNIIDLYV